MNCRKAIVFILKQGEDRTLPYCENGTYLIF